MPDHPVRPLAELLCQLDGNYPRLVSLSRGEEGVSASTRFLKTLEQLLQTIKLGLEPLHPLGECII